MTLGVRLETLLESSPGLRSALQGIDRAAASDRPILVLGEPGTGRSALARACHQASPRGDRPAVELDAGAVPSALFESELFGHVRGAFTGTEGDHEGRVARASGGSLIIDRIELLPVDCQPKLLRLLAEHHYTPLGGQEVEADVRFMAIGPDDLAARAESGRFRPDLFYRLEVLAFRVPPLRQRIDDLECLAAAMLEDLARRFGRACPRLGATSLDWMHRHHWPGNLRELRNVLERAMLTDDGTVIDPPPQRGSTAPETLASVERAHILRVLAHTRGRQGEAAKLLGISRKALWEKRKRFGLP